MTSDRSILITGCSSGIGYHCAHALQSRGWRVFATCRKAQDVARLTGEGLESFELDLDDPASVEAGASEALERTDGKLYALFNNGAFAQPGASEDLPRAAWKAIFETNFFGQIDLTNHIVPAMRAAGRGRIINCSSVLGLTSARFRGPYCASKFALESWTDTMRLENTDPNLHFVLIEPGPITSLIRENSLPHFEKWITVEGSAHEELYRKVMIPRLNDQYKTRDRFELGPEAVMAKLDRALTAKNPAARYYVTTPTYMVGFLRRVLPTFLLDKLAARI